MRVLVTRPAETGADTARLLLSAGFQPVSAPLSEVVPTGAALPLDDPAFLVATSAQAFRFLPAAQVRTLVRRPIFVVGEATARAAIRAGWLQPQIGPGTAAGLAANVCDAYAHRPEQVGATGLYLTGEPRRPDLEKTLAAAGVALRVVVLYRNAPVAALPEKVRAALARGEPLAVLHYSAVGAQTFLRLCAAADLSHQAGVAWHVAMSPAVAMALATDAAMPTARTIVARSPNESAMIDALMTVGTAKDNSRG